MNDSRVRFQFVKAPPTAQFAPELLQRSLDGVFVLEARAGQWWHRYILVFRPDITLGKSRNNHYILRFTPYGDPKSDLKSNTINREMGRFVFRDGRLYWNFNKPRTVETQAFLNEKPITTTEPVELADQSTIDLVQGMSLRVMMKTLNESTASELNDYRAAIEKQLVMLSVPGPARDFGLGASHQILNVFVSRKSDPNCETLVWLPRLAWIGQSPNNGLRLHGAGIEPIHARLIYHDGRLAIEDQESNSGTFVESRRLGRGELALLHPGNTLRIGEAQLVLKPYDPNEYLDRAKEYHVGHFR